MLNCVLRNFSKHLMCLGLRSFSLFTLIFSNFSWSFGSYKLTLYQRRDQGVSE